MSLAGELVMRCFHARTAAHVLHLKTRSYAVHTALQGFYDDLIPLVDSFAEAYQGDYGLIDTYPARYTPYDDGQKLLEDLSSWIDDHRDECCDAGDTHLHNILDEIVALIRTTQYKLRFLK